MPKIVLTLTLIICSQICALPTSANLVQSQGIIPNRDEYRYEYADGAGNLYLIGGDSIDYRPITREQSSSGMYDGGNPRKVKLDPGQYHSISTMLERSLNLRSIHIDDLQMARAKGTGLISKHDRNRQISSRIISMNSQERQEIEDLLDLLVGECKNMGNLIHRCGDKNK